MTENWDALIRSKLPTLILISVVYSAGVAFFINSGENPAAVIPGWVCIALASVLTSHSYFDYRNKEYIDGIIERERQSNNAIIQKYEAALNNMSKTTQAAEHYTQDKLARGITSTNVGGQSGYRKVLFRPDSTPTEAT